MDNFANLNIEEPIDLVKLCLNEYVRIKLRHGRELKGVLHAFDSHLNCLLGDAEEIHTFEEQDPNTKQMTKRVQKRRLAMLFVRGDQVILVSPSPKGS